jgi:uncharacterized protein YndB with AHSA1/START domain/DNA-binding transcriptional ArsR family regulator
MRILMLVREQEMSAGVISSHFSISRPGVSQHLTILKGANLLKERRSGTTRFYSVDSSGFAEIKEVMEAFWKDRLQDLRSISEAEWRQQKEELAKRNQISVEVKINAPHDVVYSYFVQVNKLVQWMGVEAEIEPRAEGKFHVHVSAEDFMTGQYIELHPFTSLSFTWGWEKGGIKDIPPGSSQVLIELEPEGFSTLLKVKHTGLVTARARETHEMGWRHYLARLTMVALGQDPGTDPWSTKEKCCPE